MARLPGELSVLLGDGFRGARYVFRKGTRMGRESVGMSPAVPRLAQFADSVFTVTEKAAASLLSSDEDQMATAQGFATCLVAMLVARESSDHRNLAARLFLRLAELTLARLGVENAFISAHEISAACALIRRRHKRALDSMVIHEPLTLGSVASFWAMALTCLERRHVIREIDRSNADDFRTPFLEDKPELYCLLIMGVAGATIAARYLVDPTDAEPTEEYGYDECIDSAIAVVTARFDRLSAHLVGTNAVTLLAADLEALLPFLP